VVYNQFTMAASQKDYPKVANLFAQIDAMSVYKEQARDEHDRLRDEYVAARTAEAQALAKASKCRDLAKLSEKAGAVWPEAAEAVDKVAESCTERVASTAPDPKPDRRDTRRATSAAKPDPKPDPEEDDSKGSSDTSGKDANELTNEARAAAKTGQWGKALRLCEAALAQKSGDQEAAMVCALAACNIKSASKAKKYMAKLRSPSRKGMARQICLKNGVDIPIN